MNDGRRDLILVACFLACSLLLAVAGRVGYSPSSAVAPAPYGSQVASVGWVTR